MNHRSTRISRSWRVLGVYALGGVSLLLAGCGASVRPLPTEVTAPAIMGRMTASPDAALALDATVNDSPSKQTISRTDNVDVPTFSLAEAVEFGLLNSPRLRMAEASVAKAAGQETVAFAPFLPEVELFNRAVGVSPNISPGAPGPVGGVLPSGDGNHSFAQAELGLQWTVWDFGRTSGRYQQAVTKQKITQWQLDRARQTVTFDVTSAYLHVLLTQAMRLEQEQAVVRAEAILKDAKARRLGGVADPDDVLRADVQLSEARESLVLGKEAEFAALAKLNHAMGRNATLPLRVIDAAARPAFHGSLVDCLQTAVDRRDEVRIARDAVVAAQFGLQAVEADYLPRIYILSAVGNVSGDDVRTGWHGGAGIHLNQKFYAGGRRRGEEESASADVRAATASAQSIFDAITLEVNLAYRRVLATRERIPLTETAVAQADENLRLMRVKYKNGNATPTDIVDAQTTLTRSAQRRNLATYDYLTALARLQYAMGTRSDGLGECWPGPPGVQLRFEP